MKKKYSTLLALLLGSFGAAIAQNTITFNYTGAMQTWIVPPCVTQITVTVDAGAGGIGGETSNTTQDIGGLGGEVIGVLPVVSGTTLNIFVGGQGAPGTSGGGGLGGWNGGGDAQAGYSGPPWAYFGGGGGGASDIRIGGVALANRVVVAGGGGGAGFNYFACCNYDQGGLGGGLTGGCGWSGNAICTGGSGTGGSQVAGGIGGTWGGYCTAPNGTLGIGSTDCISAIGNSGGGGGGGYYGGGAGCWSGGGGGSSYVGGLTTVTSNATGVVTANGLITILYTGGGAPLTLTNVAVNPTCGLNNGSDTVHATGGSTPYTYLWSPSGGTDSIASGLSAGTYTCMVTDQCSDTAYATITLTTVTLGVTANVTSNDLCNGGCTGIATSTIVGGVPPYTYAWTPTGGTNANATALCAGTYTITATDINACQGTATVTITQPALLTTTTTFTNALCFGGNSGTATAVPVGGTPTYTYSWSNGNTNVTATGLSAGSYTVTVTDANGCNTTATATISQPGKMSVTATGPQLDCSGNSINLTATPTGGTAPFTYSWTPGGGTASTVSANPPSTTTYSVTVTDSNGCSASTTFMVTVEPALTISVTGKTSTCAGGPISLIATGSGGDGNYTYHWLPSNKYGNSLFINPTVSTSVTVELTDGCGSAMATLVVPITVNPTPKVSFSSDVVTGCSPLCVQFRDLTTIPSGGLYQWGWNFGNGDSTIMQSPIYCYKDTGKHSISLTVTSDSGCSGTLTVLNLVDVYPSPNASFTYSPQPVSILNPLVQFTDQSTGKYQITDWLWRFTDGIQSTATSTLRNPTHNYSDTGTFCASLVVMDQHGCMDSLTSCFVVNPLFTFYIPDAFSPNGDGVNDVFLPKGSYIKNYEMYIFDRWGMKLFYSNDITVGWNGKSGGGSGIVAQEDTYVYLINVTDSKNNKHTYNGKVNLIK